MVTALEALIGWKVQIEGAPSTDTVAAFFSGMMLAIRHPEYASALYAAASTKSDDFEEAAQMLDLMVRLLPVEEGR